MDGAEHHQHGLSSFQSQKEAKGPGGLLKTELLFYQNYRWCLNPCPTFQETITYLKGELSKLEEVREEWHVTEVMTNVFLLSCALLNSADDYQAERFYRLPRRARLIPLARRARAPACPLSYRQNGPAFLPHSESRICLISIRSPWAANSSVVSRIDSGRS